MRDPLTGLLVALMTVVVLLAFAGYQVTGDVAGPRLLGRLAASLVELDRWVPTHRDDIQLLARDRPQATVLVHDLPVDVVIPASAALSATSAELRDLLRDAMGKRLYAEGRGALQDEDGNTHLSVTDPVRWTVSSLSAGAHGFWRLVLIVSGATTLALIGGMALSRRAAFLHVAAGAFTAAVLSFFAWLIAGVAGPGFESAIDQEIMLILRDGAWLGLRNALALTAIALAAFYLFRALVEPRLGYDNDDRYWPEITDQPDAYPPENP